MPMKRKATSCENDRSVRPVVPDRSSNNNDNQFLLSLLANYQQSLQSQAPSAPPAVPAPIGPVPPLVGSTLLHGLAANPLAGQLLLQGLQPPAHTPQDVPGNPILLALLQQLLGSCSVASSTPASNVLTPSFASAPTIAASPPWPFQPQVGAIMALNGSTTSVNPSTTSSIPIQSVLQQLLQQHVQPQAQSDPGLAFPSITANQGVPVSALVTPPPPPPTTVVHNSVPQRPSDDRYASMLTREMSLVNDGLYLPKYQAYLRTHLEFFATDMGEANTTVQGRKRKIRQGQVGIRCRHCSDIPVLLRGKGAVYYPQRLAGVYQAEDRTTLETERKRKVSGCGGKTYWLEACKEVGLEERDDAIWFRALERP